MASEEISLLSYTTNILAGQTYTSNPVILSQYISLSVVSKCDQILTVEFQFSGNGTDFDYVVTKSIPANSNTLLDSPVLAKWTRIVITNSSILDTTYLRFYTYGVPSNSSLIAKIDKIGNLNPTVNIGNLPINTYGEMNCNQYTPLIQYEFSRGTSGNMLTNSYALPYTDIYTFSSNFDTGVGAPMTITNGVLKFGNGASPADFALLIGQPYRYYGGQGITARFTGYFVQGLKSVLGDHPTTEYIGIGNYDDVTNIPNDCYCFGYGDPSGDVDNFGIIYINAGIRSFYPQSSWNVDRCDGSYIMPTIDFSKMNSFQISYQYLGFGMVRFYVMDPSTGLYNLVHTIERLSTVITPSNLSCPSLSLLMFTEVESGVVPVTLEDEIGISSFGLFLEGKQIKSDEHVCIETELTLPLTSEVTILTIRCDTTFYAIQNYYPIDIEYISFSCDGTKQVLFRIYKNSSLSGTSFTTPSPTRMPVSFDTSGNIISTGEYIFSTSLSFEDSQLIYFDNIHLHLSPGDIITITAQSAAVSDVITTLSCRYH
jgi:hypothetical protein